MIRNLIPVFFYLLLITACTKDSVAPEKPIEENEKQLLSLRVDGFSQSLLPFTDRIQAGNLNASLFSNAILSSGTNLSDHINTLEFKVYYGGNLVDSLRQYVDDPEFGTYENYFTPNIGNEYYVFIAGAMLDSDGDIELIYKSQNTSARTLPESVDAFSFYNSYIIGPEPQTDAILLKRFVGRLEIDLKEEIPFNAERIEITIQNTAKYFMPISEQGYHNDPNQTKDSIRHSTSKTFFINPEDIGRNDYSVDVYFILKSKLGSAAEVSNVTIRAINNLGQEMALRTITDVTLQANKRTKLTGKIFTNHPNLLFDVELNSEWDSEVPEFRF